MSQLSVEDILEATGAEVVAGDINTFVQGCAIDSRQVKEGFMFVAFKGEKQNGNVFVHKAIENGAHVCCVTDTIDEDTLKFATENNCVILRCVADDAQEFMLQCADKYRQLNPQWKVVCVTGSVGKTTTKEMTAHSLATQMKVSYTKGNFNNLIGMPMTLLNALPEDEAIVLETGMNHPHELDRLSNIARPQVSIITNVGTSHIGNLGSKKNIALAKAEILEGMNEEATLALYSQDEYSQFIKTNFADPKSINTYAVGYLQTDDIWAEDISLDEMGCASFKICFKDGYTKNITLKHPGKAVVVDVMLAMVVADSFNLDRDLCLDAISNLKPYAMRLEVKGGSGKPYVINDTYNASPSSMAEALDVMSAMRCEGRRVVVLGEMGELGDEAKLLHSLVGAYAAAKDIDMFVTIGGDLADCILYGARSVGMSEDKIVSCKTVDEALKVLKPVFAEDDLILVKASRAAELENFSKGVLS